MKCTAKLSDSTIQGLNDLNDSVLEFSREYAKHFDTAITEDELNENTPE